MWRMTLEGTGGLRRSQRKHRKRGINVGTVLQEVHRRINRKELMNWYRGDRREKTKLIHPVK